MTLFDLRNKSIGRAWRRRDIDDEHFSRAQDAWAAWACGYHGAEGKRFIASQVYA